MKHITADRSTVRSTLTTFTCYRVSTDGKYTTSVSLNYYILQCTCVEESFLGVGWVYEIFDPGSIPVHDIFFFLLARCYSKAITE